MSNEKKLEAKGRILKKDDSIDNLSLKIGTTKLEIRMGGKMPNWFHRKMHKLFFDFNWSYRDEQ